MSKKYIVPCSKQVSSNCYKQIELYINYKKPSVCFECKKKLKNEYMRRYKEVNREYTDFLRLKQTA